jgi:hypothetical protein
VLRKDIQPRGAPRHGKLKHRRKHNGVSPAGGKLIPNAVLRYANRLRVGDIPPPLLVGRYRGQLLLDGFQRTEAARLAGVDELPARIAPLANLKQAKWEADRANLDHGEPLRSNARKRVFKDYVAVGEYQNPDASLKSYREIAKDLCGMVSKTSAQRYMTELYPKIAEAISEAHGIPAPVGDNPLGGSRDYFAAFPPLASAPEDLLQGIRDAVQTAREEGPRGGAFITDLAKTLRDLLAELEWATDEQAV